MKRKALLGLVVVLLIGSFFAFDGHRLLTLEGLKAGIVQFETWRVTAPLLVAGSFFLLYVLTTALSLPGAAVMTLAAGALFGLWWGTVLVSFASSFGATLAFLASRYFLRESVQMRFGNRLKTINEGIEKDGAFYLFALRLVPVFPFFLINLLMGLTPIRGVTFYWVSQVGMLAGTAVYVNAGTRLARIEGLSGIISPGLLLSFALLGLFPLVAGKTLALIRRGRLYARWRRPAEFDRNLIVIGAGAGGLVSAYIAAAVKARVTLIEARKMGGDCLNYGCVPSKTLIKSAKLAHQVRHGAHYGLNGAESAFSFRQVMQRVHEVIEVIEHHDSVERYTGLGVEVLHGHARVVDPWTVEIALNGGGTCRLTTRSIVIAAGAEPVVPRLPGIEDTGYVTTDTLWNEFAALEHAPERLVVLGGGPVGCELAQSFARLGSRVTQVELAPCVLLREDDEVSALAREVLERDGVRVLTEHRAVRCEREGERKFLVVEHDGVAQRIEFDVLLCAVGRAARLEGYGLEELSIETDRTIVTDDYLRTLYPNIFAVGDVAGPYQFTHAAAHQAWYAVVNALFGDFKKFKVDNRVLPWSTFIDPEVARVGLNEQEAREKNVPYEVTRYGIDDLDRAITDGAAFGFVKVLTQPGKDRILGVTIVAEHAGDLLAEFVLAMKHGLGLTKILATVHAYPTWAEANKYAAGEWKRARAPARLLKWLERYHAGRRRYSLLKTLLFVLLGWFTTGPATGAGVDHDVWNELLKEHVVPLQEGRATAVDYGGMLRDRARLQGYLQRLSAVNRAEFDHWQAQEQLAFLINAYNAWTVDLVLSGYPDIHSIKDLGGFLSSPWKKEFIPLLDETRSLDDIEHRLIRGSGRYREPRIHFAVNCASIGCPALRAEAYTGARLAMQLEEQTRLFLADRTRNRWDGNTLEVSPIFKWYKRDFEQGWLDIRFLPGFFARYAGVFGLSPEDVKRLLAGAIEITYLDYDWRLNRKE